MGKIKPEDFFLVAWKNRTNFICVTCFQKTEFGIKKRDWGL